MAHFLLSIDTNLRAKLKSEAALAGKSMQSFVIAAIHQAIASAEAAKVNLVEAKKAKVRAIVISQHGSEEKWVESVSKLKGEARAAYEAKVGPLPSAPVRRKKR